MVCLVLALALWRAPVARAEASRPPGADGGEKTIAIIVGANTSPKVASLQYADDDAIRAAILFQMIGAETILLVRRDDDTQTRFKVESYPWLAGARSPTIEGLRGAFLRALKQAQEAHGRGSTVTVFFVYSGHGGRSGEGEGALLLEDGKFWRSELYADFISHAQANNGARAAFDHVHIIIDSCYAPNTVTSKGEGEVLPLEPHPMTAVSQRLSDYPNVGVITATTPSGKTQEWGEYRGGVFSHQILSAMFGAADLYTPGEPGQDPISKPDGTVTYAEAAKFIHVANAAISRGKDSKLTFFGRPPGDPTATLLRWPAKGAPRLRLRNLGGHLWIQDTTGNRWVEINKPEHSAAELILPPRTDYQQFKVDVPAGGNPDAPSAASKFADFKIAFGEVRDGDRPTGPTNDQRDRVDPNPDLQKLFTIPYGPDATKLVVDEFLFPPPTGWDAALDLPLAKSPDLVLPKPLDLPPSKPWYTRPWVWGAAAAVVAGAAATAYLTWPRSPPCPSDVVCP